MEQRSKVLGIPRNSKKGYDTFPIVIPHRGYKEHVVLGPIWGLLYYFQSVSIWQAIAEAKSALQQSSTIAMQCSNAFSAAWYPYLLSFELLFRISLDFIVSFWRPWKECWRSRHQSLAGSSTTWWLPTASRLKTLSRHFWETSWCQPLQNHDTITFFMFHMFLCM